jgi:hypothetical protein
MDDLSHHHEVVVLDQLAHRVRVSIKIIQEANANAVSAALDAGDALTEIKARVSTGWERWLRENCPSLAASSVRLYMQLSRDRQTIEARLLEDPEFSLRSARALIAKPKGKAPAADQKSGKTEEQSDLVKDFVRIWDQMSDAERSRAQSQIPLDSWLKAMTAERLAILERHAGGQAIRRAQKQRPNARLKDVRLKDFKLALVAGTEVAAAEAAAPKDPTTH